jgi:hypothetical protein
VVEVELVEHGSVFPILDINHEPTGTPSVPVEGSLAREDAHLGLKHGEEQGVAHKGVPKRGTEPGAKAVLAPDAGGAGSDERGPRCVKELGKKKLGLLVRRREMVSMAMPTSPAPTFHSPSLLRTACGRGDAERSRPWWRR